MSRHPIPILVPLLLKRPSRLKRPTSVAPMLRVTDPHFLHLLRLISPNHTLYTELHHALAIINNPDKIHILLGQPYPDTVVQLGGNDPTMIAKAARMVHDAGFEEININVGCPSDRVQAGSFGAVLMKTPGRIVEMLDAMVENGIKIPVSIKCRVGVDDFDSYEFLHDFVSSLLTFRSPPSHLILHARKCWLHGLSPAENRTIPPLQPSRVYRLALDFPDLPITLNGGLDSPQKVLSTLSYVDGAMIGRKIMTDPMFLRTLDKALNPHLALSDPTTLILTHYLSYAAEIEKTWSSTRISPLNILLRPVMMLFRGKHGKLWRRSLTDAITRGKKECAKVEKVGEWAMEGFSVRSRIDLAREDDS